MFDVIKKLDSATIRGLVVATIPLLVLIGSFFGLDEAVFSATLQGWGEKLVALVSLAGVTYAAYARLFKATPPLTKTAQEETARLIQDGVIRETPQPASRGKQGGYARPCTLALILALTATLTTPAGCETLGLPTAKGFNERLAAGYSSVTAVRDGAGAMLDGKVRAAQSVPEDQRVAILAAAKADAQNLQDQADKAREALDVARTLKGVNFEAAEQRLTSTLRIVSALQKYLEEQTP